MTTRSLNIDFSKWQFGKINLGFLYQIYFGPFDYRYYNPSKISHDNMKKMIIMIGCPGSGKSTYALKEKKNYEEDFKVNATICSTDDYFMDNGKYNFDISKLGLYHKNNQDRVKELCESGHNVIIVDNTNTTFKEQEPYVKHAIDNEYEVEFIRVYNEWSDIPEACFEKNSHGVPLDTIKAMLDRMVIPEESVGFFARKYYNYDKFIILDALSKSEYKNL